MYWRRLYLAIMTPAAPPCSRLNLKMMTANQPTMNALWLLRAFITANGAVMEGGLSVKWVSRAVRVARLTALQ
ncbi:hypothetical protein C2U42_30405 [Klebsiella oxytoca]|nr:hypothetical protein C2U42_30405 [Klebsiella oxytoca]